MDKIKLEYCTGTMLSPTKDENKKHIQHQYKRSFILNTKSNQIDKQLIQFPEIEKLNSKYLNKRKIKFLKQKNITKNSFNEKPFKAVEQF